jgi:hypothetical protein
VNKFFKLRGLVIDPDTGACTIDATGLDASTSSSERPEIISENELNYEMQRSAFISSIYNNDRSRTGG